MEPKLAESSLDKEARKKEAKAVAKEEKAEKKRQNSKVLIKRIERNKRKYVTAIHGLEVFGPSLPGYAMYLLLSGCRCGQTLTSRKPQSYSPTSLQQALLLARTTKARMRL